MFCTNCGKEIDNTAAFCKHCGAPNKAAAMQPAAKAPVNPAPVSPAPVNPAPVSPAPAAPPAGPGLANAERLVYRVKCEKCGNVYNAGYHDTCKKCGNPHTVDFVNHGFIQLYRMGHFSGSMNAQAIYLNGEGMGHVANTGTALIELAPGNYNLHCTIGMCRNCEDLVLNIAPGQIICVKSQMKMGAIKNKILLHVVSPSEMPPM